MQAELENELAAADYDHEPIGAEGGAAAQLQDAPAEDPDESTKTRPPPSPKSDSPRKSEEEGMLRNAVFFVVFCSIVLLLYCSLCSVLLFYCSSLCSFLLF